MALVELLGEKLKNKDDDVATAGMCGEGKFVGLYFSAHWCPPCRSFTPKLASFYNQFKAKGGNLEIVFISSDQNEAQFDEYYSEMPWLALPYDLREKKNDVSRKFKVQGIPMFIILDSMTGDVICQEARSEVMSDPQGANFPWKPKPFAEVIPGNFINNKKESFTEDHFKGKVLGVYFSAHWCPPCKTFTPILAEAYKKVKDSGKDFEVVFASSDRSEESFKEYFDTMPWLAIPFRDERVGELAKLFSISGIPTLAIMNADGEIITTEGRGCISKDPEGKDFPWYPPPCCSLDSYSAGMINTEPCLILFIEIEEDDEEECLAIMKPVAEEIICCEKEKGKVPTCKFVVAGDDDMVESLQQFLSIADESLPMLVLLDIPEQRSSQCEVKKITPESIRSFYDKFVNNELEWAPLGQ